MKEPQFKDVKFPGPDGHKELHKWLAETAAKKIHLADRGQDLTTIWVHETGEVLHTDAHQRLFIGTFLNLEAQTLNMPLLSWMWSKPLKKWVPSQYQNLIVESIEEIKQPANS